MHTCDPGEFFDLQGQEHHVFLWSNFVQTHVVPLLFSIVLRDIYILCATMRKPLSQDTRTIGQRDHLFPCVFDTSVIGHLFVVILPLG